MRLFVGIPLPDGVIEELLALSLRLRAAGDGLRWSAPESWHITLQFLGTTDQQQYECTVARLRELRSAPVPIALGSTDFFDHAGIFFAGVVLSPELRALQQQVTTATRTCGFIPETRPYHPHITLARAKGKEGERTLRKLKDHRRRQSSFTPFAAETFLLYESFTGAAGSQYAVRARFCFADER